MSIVTVNVPKIEKFISEINSIIKKKESTEIFQSCNDNCSNQFHY